MSESDKSRPSERLARLETLVETKFEGIENKHSEWHASQRETTRAIERLAEVTNTGFLEIGKENASAKTKLSGQAARILVLENRGESDRRAGVVSGAATGAGSAGVLALAFEALRRFFTDGSS